jgi:leucyl-tRNA synthetase
MHQSIKKVSEDVESLGFNTAVSTLMILVNDMEKREIVSKKEYETLLKLLAPFAPHVTEEIWEALGHKTSIHIEKWPDFDPQKLLQDTVTLAVQVNGKVRANLTVDKDESEGSIREKAVSIPAVEKWLLGKKVEKIIVVPGKIVSIVT